MDTFRVRYKLGDFEVEVESSQQAYVDTKLQELLKEASVLPKPPSAVLGKAKTVSHAPNRAKTVPISEEPINDSSEDIIKAVVDGIRNSPDSLAIEKNILKKSDRLARLLMCYYFAYKHAGDASLTNKDVEAITDKLRIKIAEPNVAKTIREKAGKYLTSEKGQGKAATRFKIKQSGIDAFEIILKGETVDRPPAKIAKKTANSQRQSSAKQAPSGKKGPSSYILELKQEEFFKQKRTLPEVQKKLEENGHIYAQNSLSTPILRLVRSRQLRRIKEDDVWVYVNN
jgi:hypothetical protein